MASVTFCGLPWEIRTWTGEPDGNKFAADLVWVDSNGRLHLKVAKKSDGCYSAECRTYLTFGPGTSEWQVESDINALDRNVVLGLFHYPKYNPATIKHTQEADIEMAKWADPNYPWQGKYTVFPNVDGYELTDSPFKGTPSGATTHRIIRSSSGITFQSLDSTGKQFAGWRFAPSNPLILVPQDKLLAYMDLWLIKGQAPTDGKDVEIVISKFTFTPAKVRLIGSVVVR